MLVTFNLWIKMNNPTAENKVWICHKNFIHTNYQSFNGHITHTHAHNVYWFVSQLNFGAYPMNVYFFFLINKLTSFYWHSYNVSGANIEKFYGDFASDGSKNKYDVRIEWFFELWHVIVWCCSLASKIDCWI